MRKQFAKLVGVVGVDQKSIVEMLICKQMVADDRIGTSEPDCLISITTVTKIQWYWEKHRLTKRSEQFNMFLTLVKCTAKRRSLYNLLPNTSHGAVCSFPSSPTRPSCLSLGSRFIFELWKSFWSRKNQINICHFPKNNLTSMRGTIRGYINSFMEEKKFCILLI